MNTNTRIGAIVIAALAAVLLNPTGVGAAITLGQVDNFETNTREGWDGGSNGPGQPNVSTSGGPTGTGDAFLRIQGLGNTPMGTFNDTQWSGDFIAAGVSGLTLDITNVGLANDTIELRVVLFSDGSQAAGFNEIWTTLNPLVIAPTATLDWQNYMIPLTSDNLVHLMGTKPLNDTLSSVVRFLIRHDPGTPTLPQSENLVTANVGLDNITAIAIPEPSRTVLLLLSSLLVALRRQRN